MTDHASPYVQPAKAAYARLKKEFADGDSPFWRLGHAFDTVIDYLAIVDGSDASAFATIALKKYGAGGGDWYDDYPWWGLAGLRAAQRGDLFGPRRVEFRLVAIDCWTRLDTNAPNGWKNADQVTYAAYEPLYDGGVWNHVIDAGCNPSDSSSNGLCGRQNTVTNALYLGLATRLLLEYTTNPAYKAASDREMAFLTKWLVLNDPDRALMYYYQQGRRDTAVVRERVGRFKRDGVADAKYRSDLAWAGDQGLVLSGVVDRMRRTPDNSTEYKSLLVTANQLIAGTTDYLVDRGSDPSGILRPWWPNPSPDRDDTDYWTGPAVFMRALLYAYQTNSDLQKRLLQQNFQNFVKANADFVVADPDRRQSDDMVVNWTNNLATLVTAIGVLAP